MLVRDIRNLKEEIKKENLLDKAMGDLDWANGKVSRLEEALEKATADIEEEVMKLVNGNSRLVNKDNNFQNLKEFVKF